MREKKLENIRKFGKIGYVFSTFVLIFSIALFSILIFYSIAFNKNIKSLKKVNIIKDLSMDMKFDGKFDKKEYKKNPIYIMFDNKYGAIDDESLNFDNGKTQVNLKSKVAEEVNVSRFWRISIGVCAGIIVYIINLLLFRSIFKTLRDDNSPFNIDMVRKLKRFALSFIPWIFISSVFDYINSRGVFEQDFYISINLNSLIFVAIIYILAKIFEYGVDLQVESDDIV